LRIGAIPENPLEWLALRLGRVPLPLIDTHVAFAFARTVMIGARVGLFEALADGEATAADLAVRCGTALRPTEQLVHALVALDYLLPGRAPESVRLSRVARRYLTRGAPANVIDKVLFAYDEWEFVAGYDDYLRSGRSVDMHAALRAPLPPTPSAPPAAPPAAPPSAAAASFATPAYERYQRGLHAVAGVSAAEVARALPIPRGARDLLDVGGAHGRFAAAILRAHPRLRADVLDLPHAVAASAPLLAAEGLGERLRHRSGDALHDPLGDAAYDVVFASQFNHHLSDDANRALAQRVAAALRPGGIYVVQDLLRPASVREARRARLGALFDLYFGAASGAGTFTERRIHDWMREAGLMPRGARWLATLPGLAQIVAGKPPPSRRPRR
jgi:SAM-dependent methyltransferase